MEVDQDQRLTAQEAINHEWYWCFDLFSFSPSRGLCSMFRRGVCCRILLRVINTIESFLLRIWICFVFCRISGNAASDKNIKENVCAQMEKNFARAKWKVIIHAQFVLRSTFFKSRTCFVCSSSFIIARPRSGSFFLSLRNTARRDDLIGRRFCSLGCDTVILFTFS